MSIVLFFSSNLQKHKKQKRWMFEKYDGVRGFWNPLRKAFYSRKGNRFTFPPEIIDAMPKDIFLDGELWYLPQHYFLSCLFILN